MFCSLYSDLFGKRDKNTIMFDLLILAFLWCVVIYSQLCLILVFQAYQPLSCDFFPSVPFFSLADGRGELARHFMLNSEDVAMVVARDLAKSDVESPNIKGVLLMQRQKKLSGMSNRHREFFF